MLYLFSLISLEKKGKSTKVLMIISSLWLILIEGLRWNIGTDWDNYYNFFVYDYDEGHMELGYALLIQGIKNISKSFSCYLVLQACLTVYAFTSFIRNFSPIPLMSLCIFFCTTVGLWGMNRQFIALDISLLSISFILRREKTKFLICILLAFFFHKSAILFLPAYYMYDFKFSKKYMLIILAVVFIIGLSGVLKKISLLNFIAFYTADSGTMTKMLTDDANSYSYLGTIKRIVYLFLFYKLYAQKVTDKNVLFFFNFYLLGVIMFLLFNGSNFQIFVSRGALYYNLSEIILIPMFFKYYIKSKQTIAIGWLALFILLISLMNRDLSSYIPLAGYDVFRPYKSILFDLF